MAKKKKKNYAVLRPALMVSCIVMGLVLVVLLSATVYAEYLLNQMNYYQENPRETMSQQEAEEFLKQETDPEDENYTGSEMNAEDVVLETVEEKLETSENVVNILLIGADYQSGDIARSDSMILCTFNKTKNTITMTSFMRDLYVKIPGYGKNKINASYSIGGMQMLENTLEHNFGVQVDGIVEVDFSQFEKLIDLLGGVELDVTYMEAEFINLKNHDRLKQGVQVLNGKQALWYSRFRGDGGGDFNRTNRQRVVLGKLIENYRNSSLTDLMAMMDDILPMVTTNMDKNDIVSYVTGLFPMLVGAEIITQRIPAEGGYYMTKIDGRSVLVPNISFNVKILKDTIMEE